jgi:hypothetical protein
MIIFSLDNQQEVGHIFKNAKELQTLNHMASLVKKIC